MRAMSRRFDRMIQFIADSKEIEEVDDLVAMERALERAEIERHAGAPSHRHTTQRFADITMFRDIVQSSSENVDECARQDKTDESSDSGSGDADDALPGASPQGDAATAGDSRPPVDPIKCLLRDILGDDAIQSGRGRARVTVPEGVDNPEALLIEAARRASHALGPSWSLPPPSAPARVELADTALVSGERLDIDPGIDEDIDPGIDEILAEAADDLLKTIDRELKAREETRAGQPRGNRASRVSGLASTAMTAATTAIRASSVAIAVQRRKTRLRTSRRFQHAYVDTMTTVDIVLGRSTPADSPTGAPGAPTTGSAGSIPSGRFIAGMTEHIRLQARRLADLDLAQHVRRGAEQLERRAAATALPPGRYDLVLTRGALLPDNVSYGQASLADVDDERLLDAIPHLGFAPTRPEEGSNWQFSGRYAWFEPIAAQADARATRLGLSRYRIGQSIHGDQPITGDPLTIISDGTLPFGLLSSPVGELGEPVRRFTLVERGVAAGLAFDVREAALRGVGANGGVRNLVIEPGKTLPEDLHRPARRPLLEARDLAWLDIDPATGNFTCEIALADLHAAQTIPRPTTGGILQGNIFHLLASARLSSQIFTKGWYTGPEAIRFPDIEVT